MKRPTAEKFIDILTELKDYDDYYVVDDIINDAIAKYHLTEEETLKRLTHLKNKKSILVMNGTLKIYHKSVIDDIGNLDCSTVKAKRGWGLIAKRYAKCLLDI